MDKKSIYLIECGNLYYKIGIANRVEDRLKDLSVGNPLPLYIVTKKRVERARELERAFHLNLKHKKVKGEWFKLSPSEVLEICTIIHSEKKCKKFSSSELVAGWPEERVNPISEREGILLNIKQGEEKEKAPVRRSYKGDRQLAIEAITLIKTHNRASATFLQLELKIGYTRASRIMNILERKGIVGPLNGARARVIK